MKYFIFTAMLLLGTASLTQAQTEAEFTIIEKSAEPKGGMESFFSYIRENMVVPQDAKDAGSTGKVFVGLVVDVDGSLTELKVLRSLHPSCDEEALRLIQAAPKWIPSESRGEAVAQRMIMPITF